MMCEIVVITRLSLDIGSVAFTDLVLRYAQPFGFRSFDWTGALRFRRFVMPALRAPGINADL
jgi:hypothetical protein